MHDRTGAACRGSTRSTHGDDRSPLRRHQRDGRTPRRRSQVARHRREYPRPGPLATLRRFGLCPSPGGLPPRHRPGRRRGRGRRRARSRALRACRRGRALHPVGAAAAGRARPCRSGAPVDGRPRRGAGGRFRQAGHRRPRGRRGGGRGARASRLRSWLAADPPPAADPRRAPAVGEPRRGERAGRCRHARAGPPGRPRRRTRRAARPLLAVAASDRRRRRGVALHRHPGSIRSDRPCRAPARRSRELVAWGVDDR